MSTIKSSDEHLTLNADGSGKSIKFQANGVEKASISSAGVFTATGIDATKLTGSLPAVSGANLTGLAAFPSGTVMAFFQANAPTGWTKVTTQNDKMLRVVSGTGGGTGGDWAVSAGETTSSHGGHTHAGAAHSHNHNLSAGAHTLSTSEMPSHTHNPYNTNNYAWNSMKGFNNAGHGSRTGGGQSNHEFTHTGGGSSHSHSLSGSISSGGAGDTGSGGSHTHTIAAPQYIDVIICSKDA